MKNRTLFSLSAVALVIGLTFVPTASAQVPLPEQSTWNISEPTDVGGTVLQPGSYRITAVARPNDRNVVRVSSPDGQTLYATVLTVPHQLAPNEDASNTTFVYFPPVSGQPRVLRTWFPADPMSAGGHDIVYSQERARQLASAAQAPIITYQDTVTAADFETTDLYVVTPEARVERYVVPAPMTSQSTLRTQLPATASNTPMIALLGLLSIAGAFAVRAAIR